MVASVLILTLMISQAHAFRVDSRNVRGRSNSSATASAFHPMNAPVLIRSHRHQHLQDANGRAALTSNADGWERWVISEAGNGKVTIKSHRNQYLQDRNGQVGLSRNSEEWEHWTIATINGTVTIKSHRDQYLQDYNGHLTLTDNNDAWEQWSILPFTTTTTTPAFPTPDPVNPGTAITIVSYNLMSWCTQRNCRGGRMKVIADGIRRHKPAVLGTQEHDDGGYDTVKASLASTGLTHSGAATYYDASVVEPVTNVEEIAILGSWTRRVSGQIYKVKGCSGSNCEFGFYNTHWGHSSHGTQANKVIDFMNRHSEGRPKVITGDFNVWGSKWPIDHIKNSLDMAEASDPDEDTWCTGGKVDFILASRKVFARSGAIVDSNNCGLSCDGCNWKGSDHKLLKVNLTLV